MIDGAQWAAQTATLQLYANPKSVLLTSDKLRTLTGYPAGEWCELWDALITRYHDAHSPKATVLRPFGRAVSAKAESYVLAFSGPQRSAK